MLDLIAGKKIDDPVFKVAMNVPRIRPMAASRSSLAFPVSLQLGRAPPRRFLVKLTSLVAIS